LEGQGGIEGGTFFLGWEVDWLAKFLNYVASDRRFIKYG